MTNPLRREREDLSTDDIAQQKPIEPSEAAIEEGRPKLVQSERQPAGTAAIAHPEATAQRDANLRDAGQRDGQATPPLFPANELQDLRRKWDQIQAGFVDEPRKAVGEADNLVASTMKRLAEVFAQERSNLEGQWDRGDNISTEDLRLALQRYRSFFHRLLAI
jgi:hypothetical protein